MATPKHRRPPLPYVADYAGTGANRFSTLGMHPIPKEALDAEFNAIADYINEQLVDAIDNIIAGVIVGADKPENQDKLVTTDGDGNISWVKVDAAHIEDKSIINDNIADETLTGDKIATGSLETRCYADRSVTNAKIADTTVELRKTRAKGSNCILGSSALDESYREIIPLDSWQVPTIENNHPRFEYVTTLWNQSPDNVASGAKIADATITGAKITDGTIADGKIINVHGAKIQVNTMPGDKITAGTLPFSALPHQTLRFAGYFEGTATETSINVTSNPLGFTVNNIGSRYMKTITSQYICFGFDYYKDNTIFEFGFSPVACFWGSSVTKLSDNFKFALFVIT